MKVLVACEESQRVCIAFRKKDTKPIRATLSNVREVILNGTSYKMLFRC